MVIVSGITAQHFRSLANVSLEMQNITVLVGVNSSGKSNFIDAFRFLRDTSQHGLGHAVDQRGGISIVRQHSSTKPYNVSLDVNLEDDRTNSELRYSVRFSGRGSRLRVEGESARWYQARHTPRPKTNADIDSDNDDAARSGYSLEPTDFVRDRDGNITINGETQENQVADQETILNRPIGLRGRIVPFPIARFFANMRFASVYPNTMREPRRLETEHSLHEDCGNWGSMIRRMRQTRAGQAALDRILEMTRLALPELKQISVKNVGGYVIPQFLMQSAKRGGGHYLDPIQMSDGTLRLFGLLLHLYQTPRPSFLALEEPEQTIHPGLLSVLVDAINEVSSTVQVVITTHSPHVLDLFPVNSIRVVTRDEDETSISEIRKSQVKTVQEGLMSISELMALDGLKPQR